jgi:hypothetical protein
VIPPVPEIASGEDAAEGDGPGAFFSGLVTAHDDIDRHRTTAAHRAINRFILTSREISLCRAITIISPAGSILLHVKKASNHDGSAACERWPISRQKKDEIGEMDSEKLRGFKSGRVMKAAGAIR